MSRKKGAKRATQSRSPIKRSPSKATSGRVKILRVPKPWGYETIWAQSERYVGKILHINAGQELSVQYHNKKDETVYLFVPDPAGRP